MAENPNVCLSLESRPENVLIVRQVLSGVAEAAGINALELNDISTAVSEACNNVVQHAYGDAHGPMEVELYLQPGTLCAIVRDHGAGIRPLIDGAGEEGAVGIGLPLILALATRVEFVDPPGGGLEVHLEFKVTAEHTLTVPAGSIPAWSRHSTSDLADGTVRLDIAPAEIVRAVMGRVVCALAARAAFSTDGIAHAQELADSLAAHTANPPGTGHLRVGIIPAPGARALEMRVGPLRSGAELGDLEHVLSRLAEDYSVTRDGPSEVLAVRLTETR